MHWVSTLHSLRLLHNFCNVHCTIIPFYHQGMVLLGFVTTMMHGHAFLTAYKIGMHSRITLTAAIYQKVCEKSTIIL